MTSIGTSIPPRDGLERYFAEKIWEWIPSNYRHEDGLADPPHVLRALVELLAHQAMHARRTTDRLWEDAFIQTCDDWAVPYIGNLLATRLIGSLNRRGRRVDVARTIFYRRRKGTPLVMEALIQDITGWEGAVVESFKRLARARHGLDPEPLRLAGPLTRTPPGGTTNLRHGRLGGILDGPFDGLAHTPDVRRLRGFQGRYNIPKLNFFLYRLFAYEVIRATPWHFGSDRFTFDPSGRDIPLFRPSQRTGNAVWTPVEEWQLPAPIPCRLLDTFRAQLVPAALALAVAPDEADDPLPASELQAGNLIDWSLPATAGLKAHVDPDRGRFVLTSPLTGADEIYAQRYHYGFSGDIGAGTYDRFQSVQREGATSFDGALDEPGPVTAFTLPSTGVHQFINSKTYHPDAPAANTVDNIKTLVLQSADRERPYITLVPGASATEWIFRAAPKANHDDVRALTLEGLWIGVLPTGIPEDPSGELHPVEVTLVLDGEFDTVRISHCTLDPGGERARLDPGIVQPIPSVTVDIRGQVRKLVVEASIVGAIRESTTDADPCSAGSIVIRDSIVQSLVPGVPALETRVAGVTLERVTVFGDVSVNQLYATEALIQGVVRVQDNQHGCFRFSTAQEATDMRMPKRFESPLFAPVLPNHFFLSRRFGEAGFAQVSATAPEAILRGAENHGEMGAFNSLLNPVKRDDLETKVLEYMPFGLIPQFIFET